MSDICYLTIKDLCRSVLNMSLMGNNTFICFAISVTVVGGKDRPVSLAKGVRMTGIYD